MKLDTRIFLGLTLGLVVSVGQADQVAPSLPELPPVQAKEGVSRGLLMQYQGKMIFSPCRERTYVQLEDLSENQRVSESLKQFGLADNRPLYVEFVGLAERGTLKAKWLNFVGRQANCQATANLGEQWRALGSGWSLRVGSAGVGDGVSGVSARLDVDGKAPVEHSPVKVTLTGQDKAQRAELSLDGAAQPRVLWSFERQFCRLPNVDALFGWQAVSGNSTDSAQPVLQGCAWQGYE